MNLSELDYEYPPELVATEPQRPCRILLASSPDLNAPKEIDFENLWKLFAPGDLLVVNNTKVEKRRVFSVGGHTEGLEILFLQPANAEQTIWQVLCPAKNIKDDEIINLPGDLKAKLTRRGLPQTLELSAPIDHKYFTQYGEMALPPYIQKARGDRHNKISDSKWYQTEWAKYAGSSAAPTASLHFKNEDLNELKKRNVQLAEVTLHVGAGTFLPVRTENLDDHPMHGEWAEIPQSVAAQIEKTLSDGRRVWAMGTTVARVLESFAAGVLTLSEDKNSFIGETKLFIKPGYSWQIVGGLLTNFHQPKSTLLALVAAFSGIETQRKAYREAMEKRFRLFSYGDLSVWLR